MPDEVIERVHALADKSKQPNCDLVFTNSQGELIEDGHPDDHDIAGVEAYQDNADAPISQNGGPAGVTGINELGNTQNLNLAGSWRFPIYNQLSGSLRAEVANVTDEQEQIMCSLFLGIVQSIRIHKPEPHG